MEDEYLEFVCFDIQKDDPHYPHVQMEPKSEWLNRYYTAIGTDASFRQIPIVRELLSMGLYFWLLVQASLYLIYQKEYEKLLWILPLWMYLGTSLLGPAGIASLWLSVDGSLPDPVIYHVEERSLKFCIQNTSHRHLAVTLHFEINTLA